MAEAMGCRFSLLRYYSHHISSILKLRQSVVEQTRRPLSVHHARNQVRALVCGARTPEAKFQPFLPAVIVDGIVKESSGGRSSRSTTSEALASAQNVPQPSFRKRFFDHIRKNAKFEGSTHRPGGKMAPDLDETFEKLKRQLSTLLIGRSSEDSSRLTETKPGDSDKEIRSALEDQCSTAAPNLNLDKILILADLWYSISQFDLRVPRFHKTFLERVAQESAAPSLPQCLQILLYSAVYRKIPLESLEKIKKIVLAEASNLDTLEMDLVAFAAYVLRMDFRRQPDFLSRAANVLLDEKVDLSDMVNILKFLRQNDFLDLAFTNKLNDRLRTTSFEASSGVECCYLLQAFASTKFYDEILFEKLQTQILRNLSEQKELYGRFSSADLQQLHPSRRLRAKDLASYLHSLSVMNHRIKRADLLIEDLKHRMKAQEFANLPDFLVQSLHALSLQGIYEIRLLSSVFSATTARKLALHDLKDAQRWLYCLFKNCQIEFPEGIGQIGVTENRLAGGLHPDFFNVGYEMSHRSGRQVLEQVECSLVEKYGKEAVEFCRQVPHLEISGFKIRLPATDLLERLKNPKDFTEGSAQISRKIAVEVLDSWTSAVNVKRPLGMAALKKRLLIRQGWSVEDAHIQEEECNPKTQ